MVAPDDKSQENKSKKDDKKQQPEVRAFRGNCQTQHVTAGSGVVYMRFLV